MPAATKLLRRVLLSGDATMLPKLADWVHSKGLGQDLSKGGLNEFSSVEQSLQKAHDAVLRKAQEAHQKAQQDLVERAAAKKREEEACLKALAESDRKAAAELAARQAEEAAALAQSRRQEQERHAAALREARVAAELDAFLQLDGSLGTASKDICRMWCVGFRGTRRGPKFLAMSHKLQLKKLASNLAHITRSDVLIISLGHDPTALQETKRELCEAAPALEKFIWQSFPTAVVQNHAGGQYAEFIALARGPSVVAFNLPQVLSVGEAYPEPALRATVCEHCSAKEVSQACPSLKLVEQLRLALQFYVLVLGSFWARFGHGLMLGWFVFVAGRVFWRMAGIAMGILPAQRQQDNEPPPIRLWHPASR